MRDQRWTREGARGGPANVLDGRWEVGLVGDRRWGVYDRLNGRWWYPTFRAMKRAKAVLQAWVDAGGAEEET